MAQDDYCVKALKGDWADLAPTFPEDYQWEALVDVLRGRVKVREKTILFVTRSVRNSMG